MANDNVTTPRGTSPSKAHDKASETSWKSRVGETDPKAALNNSPTKNPVSPESVK